jgi:hypothetical protein
MVLLPPWKEMDLDEYDVPDWLWVLFNARQVAGFPVQFNLTGSSLGSVENIADDLEMLNDSLEPPETYHIERGYLVQTRSNI